MANFQQLRESELKDIIKQVKKEKRYYVVSLSLLCLILLGLLFWSLEIKEPEHNFDCEIVVTPKEDNSWL